MILGAVTMALMLGGGVFAYRVYKENRPQPIWVPLPINPKLPGSKRDEVVKDLKEKLDTPEILLRVSQDLNLAELWSLPSEAAAGEELSKRLFVTLGESHTGVGPTPTIDIGVTGAMKEKALSEKIAMRLMEDVWKIIGIDPPPRK